MRHSCSNLADASSLVPFLVTILTPRLDVLRPFIAKPIVENVVALQGFDFVTVIAAVTFTFCGGIPFGFPLPRTQIDLILRLHYMVPTSQTVVRQIIPQTQLPITSHARSHAHG